MAAICRTRISTFVSAVQRLYPLALANKTWDNTGLLLEAPPLPSQTSKQTSTVLLTIDLTRAVCSEALRLNADFVLTYHPIIFRPLKSLTLADSQQETLLRLAQAGVSVYSPHTAVDAAVGGVNDWLCDGIVGDSVATRAVIEAGDVAVGGEGCGIGRVVTLAEGVSLDTLVARVKKLVGIERVMIVRPSSTAATSDKIKTIAVCAGSGGSLFKGIEADAYFTGELSHHEALAARESGRSVVCAFHTNTERGFLAVMRQKLQTELEKEEEEEEEGGGGKGVKWEVKVSTEDRDPFEIL